MDEYSDPIAIGKAMRESDNEKVVNPLVAPLRELAACLRGAVTGLELLQEEASIDGYLPGLPALIERSKQALKEYDK